jgi:Transglycosylase SLT domain
MDFPSLPPAIAQVVRDKAAVHGLNPTDLARMVKFESSGNPRAVTPSGTYKGLLQLSDSEFNKYGGGNIYDVNDNLDAGAKKLVAERAQFRQNYGRDPTPTDTYMQHQQGVGGYAAHSAAPDAPAWQNMASTAEGRQKGGGWAKQAIWGNMTDKDKQNFPNGVESVTSRDFINLWHNKVEGNDSPAWSPTAPSGDTPGLTVASASPAPATPSAPAAPSGILGLQIPGMTPQTQNDASNNLALAGLQLMNQGSQLPPPPPLRLNFPQPVGLRLAQAASNPFGSS